MRKFIYIVLVISMFFCLSCNKPKKDKVNKSFLVYLVGNNNLTPYMEVNLSSLKNISGGAYLPEYTEIGEEGEILLVYKNLLSEVPKLLRLSQDSRGNVIEEIIYEFEEHNSLDPTIMKDVLEKANSLFPADEKGLLFSSHASGWVPIDFYGNNNSLFAESSRGLRYDTEKFSSNGITPLSFGVDNGREMDIKDFAKAIPTKYSYIIFDCCLMGGIEVVYEFKDVADYIVSSSSEILATGFPYNKLVEPLLKYDKYDIEKVAKDYFEYYNSKTSQNARSATVSVVKTSELKALATAVKSIVDNDGSRIPSLDMTKIQGFFRSNEHWYYDMEDFYSRISSNVNNLECFMQCMKKAVIYKAATPTFLKYEGGYDINTFSGLSNYIPNPTNSALDSYYSDYKWNKDIGLIKN